MSAYLYPNLKSKKAFKEAIKAGQCITAQENIPWGTKRIENGKCTFEGPHYPEPHKFYGQVVVESGVVVKIE